MQTDIEIQNTHGDTSFNTDAVQKDTCAANRGLGRWPSYRRPVIVVHCLIWARICTPPSSLAASLALIIFKYTQQEPTKAPKLVYHLALYISSLQLYSQVGRDRMLVSGVWSKTKLRRRFEIKLAHLGLESVAVALASSFMNKLCNIYIICPQKRCKHLMSHIIPTSAMQVPALLFGNIFGYFG